jgi:membrane protein implicated in regulation of membrane protease activity
MRYSFAGPLITIAVGLIIWLALPSVLGPVNLALAGQIIFWVGVVYLVILLIAAAVPSRRRSTRRTVQDPGTGERIERSETDLS